MGFRGSRVQIPPSRLSEDQASHRVLMWGFFFVAPRAVRGGIAVEAQDGSRASAHAREALTTTHLPGYGSGRMVQSLIKTDVGAGLFSITRNMTSNNGSGNPNATT